MYSQVRPPVFECYMIAISITISVTIELQTWPYVQKVFSPRKREGRQVFFEFVRVNDCFGLCIHDDGSQFAPVQSRIQCGMDRAGFGAGME